METKRKTAVFQKGNKGSAIIKISINTKWITNIIIVVLRIVRNQPTFIRTMETILKIVADR